MIKGSYYIAENEYVPAFLVEELSWAGDPAITSGKRVLLSVEFQDGQKRTLTAGEITKEEIADSGVPSPIPKGRFIRDYIEIPSTLAGSVLISEGMEAAGINYVVGHGTFGVTLPTPIGNSGKKITIKDASGFVGGVGDEILITCSEAGDIIEGAAAREISTAFGFVEFISDGTQWLAFASNP
jgi:hypothetical protein